MSPLYEPLTHISGCIVGHFGAVTQWTPVPHFCPAVGLNNVQTGTGRVRRGPYGTFSRRVAHALYDRIFSEWKKEVVRDDVVVIDHASKMLFRSSTQTNPPVALLSGNGLPVPLLRNVGAALPAIP